VHSLCHEELPKQQCSSSNTDLLTCTTKATTMTAQSTSSKNSAFEKQQTSSHPSYKLSADGACDEVGGARSKSPLNIHKALPPVPPLDSSISRTPQSASINTPSFAPSQDKTNRPSTACSVSSGRSRSSSKTDFRIITRGLVNPDMAGRKVALSPVEPDMYLNPGKYDPGNPSRSPRT
jgi:hypothetical protein